MHRRVRGVVLIAVLAAGAVAACSDDHDTAGTSTTPASQTRAPTSASNTGAAPTTGVASEAEYVAAIERSLSTGDALVITPEQAGCVAPRWLDTITVARLEAHDVLPSDIGDDVGGDGSRLSDLELNSDEGGALLDAFDACQVDVRQLFVDLIAGDTQPDVAACVEPALTPELVRRLMISSIVDEQPDDQLQADYDAAIEPCRQLSATTPPTTTG
jgi:hypothetical protein